jgi:hypothetical protein
MKIAPVADVKARLSAYLSSAKWKARLSSHATGRLWPSCLRRLMTTTWRACCLLGHPVFKRYSRNREAA